MEVARRPGLAHDGLICTGEAYKNVVKHPSGLFNSSLEGNARRAIDMVIENRSLSDSSDT